MRHYTQHISEFEKTAHRTMLRMSDGSRIRVLRRCARNDPADRLVLLFIAGWGSVPQGWDTAILEFANDFDVYYVETREKRSSILHRNAVNDLARLSTDLREIIDHFKLDEGKLVVFGSSWGGVIAAHALTQKRLAPRLAVFAAPIGRLGLPPFTRYLVPFAPPVLLTILKPVLRYWLVKMRSEDAEQAATYLRILNDADAVKWKSVAKHTARESYWQYYATIGSPTLIISIDSGDKFHTKTEAETIAELVPNCGHISVRSVTEMASPLVVEFVRAHLKSNGMSVMRATDGTPRVECRSID